MIVLKDNWKGNDPKNLVCEPNDGPPFCVMYYGSLLEYFESYLGYSRAEPTVVSSEE